MGAFEHVISLLSFVYALALTHLLYCIAQMIRSWRRVVVSWIHAFWVLNAFLVIIANWISFWDLHVLPAWSTGTICFTFLMAFVNYLQAALVCPEIPDEGPIDLVWFHAEHGRQYLGMVVGSVILALLANIVYGGEYDVTEWTKQNMAVVPMLFATGAAFIWRTKWVDIAAPVVVAATWLYYFVDLQTALK